MKLESVWDYPRPPRCEAFSGHIRIIHANTLIADTNRAFRVLETSHPPVYYIPPEDIRMELIVKNPHKTFCEFKGRASYVDLIMPNQKIPHAGWYYPSPASGFENIRDHIAFYPSKMDSCIVNDEKVQAQEGDFYGGWITSNIKGPFKGGAGTWGW